jgi:outer membrane protein assembly factor BamE
MRNLPRTLATATLAALLASGCGVLYRQPIYQGNLLEPAAVEQLQAGLTQQQVIALLGTPSITDPFHHERWDYTSTRRVGRTGPTEVKNLTLWFESGVLARWEGDYFPEQDAEIAKRARREFGPNLRRDADERR